MSTSRWRVKARTAYSDLSGAFRCSDVALRPSLEIELRHDEGDAENGHALEVGGRLGLSDPARGLSIYFEGMTLGLHDEGASESLGVGLGVSWVSGVWKRGGTGRRRPAAASAARSPGALMPRSAWRPSPAFWRHAKRATGRWGSPMARAAATKQWPNRSGTG